MSKLSIYLLAFRAPRGPCGGSIVVSNGRYVEQEASALWRKHTTLMGTAVYPECSIDPLNSYVEQTMTIYLFWFATSVSSPSNPIIYLSQWMKVIFIIFVKNKCVLTHIPSDFLKISIKKFGFWLRARKSHDGERRARARLVVHT